MKTILLTEDNQDMVDLMQVILKDSGYNMITASDGIEAVRVCLEQSPDLVLMDLNMPNMDGFHATMVLRDKGFKNPIVVLTGSESEEDRKKAAEVGCNEYILKTLEMSDVERVIDHYLYEADSSL
jgi:CheY-like chemotaxis protein